MRSAPELAGELADVALRNLSTEFPHATQHVIAGPEDRSRPRELHPAFHGAFDWHSCVHMHWLLVRLLTDHADRVDTDAIRTALNETLTPSALAEEAAYLRDNPSFEKPYGWAWAAALASACEACPDPSARAWSGALAGLLGTVERLVLEWLDRAVAPVRHGAHHNTAFALALLIDAGAALDRGALVTACTRHAQAWFGADHDYPARWEPSGQDFLSPALCEADLMRRVLPAERFPGWLGRFLPGLADGEPSELFTPATVRDTTDGRQVHLYGLNLSRAWQFRALAAALPSADARRPAMTSAAERHLADGLPAVSGRGFATEHWLATYAYLALTGPSVV